MNIIRKLSNQLLISKIVNQVISTLLHGQLEINASSLLNLF